MSNQKKQDVIINNKAEKKPDYNADDITNKANRAGIIGFIFLWFIVFTILYIQGIHIRGAGMALLNGTIGSQFLSRYIQVRKNGYSRKQQNIYLVITMVFIITCIYGLLTLLNII